jgi:enoyl-CoA hydratase/carnithine racemase
MTEKKLFKIEIVDKIALVTINNPPLNLLSYDLLLELRDIVEEFNKDPDIRCIILTGEGKAFSAGGDVTTFGVLPRGLNPHFGHMVMNTIDKSPIPVIAALNGYTLGGGLELAVACDIRIASDKAKIGLVEASLGILGAYGGNTRLPWLIGEQSAKKLFFTAARISGEEALECGLVSEVVPHEQLLDRAMELARQITANAPRSIATAKNIMFRFRDPLFSAGFFHEQHYSTALRGSYDTKEGWQAFKEKRKPNFQNR